VLVECDFSQIEFRLVADQAKEWSLIKAINKGLDPHALTTKKIFDIPLAEVTRDMWQRDAAKTLGFAILYGASAPSVKMQIKLQSGKGGRTGIDVPVEQVQEWIDDYTGDKGYPAIGDWISENAAEARRDGYVADMWGHRRYLPGARSELGSVRAESERIATNHKAQAGAAGIIKKAMIELWEDVLPKYRSKGYCEPLLQAYDALNFEVDGGIAKEFVGELGRVMRGAVKLDVKMDVDSAMGLRWNKLEKV
jgi:DNA polymerase-1